MPDCSSRVIDSISTCVRAGGNDPDLRIQERVGGHQHVAYLFPAVPYGHRVSRFPDEDTSVWFV